MDNLNQEQRRKAMQAIKSKGEKTVVLSWASRISYFGSIKLQYSVIVNFGMAKITDRRFPVLALMLPIGRRKLHII